MSEPIIDGLLTGARTLHTAALFAGGCACLLALAAVVVLGAAIHQLRHP